VEVEEECLVQLADIDDAESCLSPASHFPPPPPLVPLTLGEGEREADKESVVCT
jgi:hypothetical protein